jgi:hypothetical protein
MSPKLNFQLGKKNTSRSCVIIYIINFVKKNWEKKNLQVLCLAQICK